MGQGTALRIAVTVLLIAVLVTLVFSSLNNLNYPGMNGNNAVLSCFGLNTAFLLVCVTHVTVLHMFSYYFIFIETINFDDLKL